VLPDWLVSNHRGLVLAVMSELNFAVGVGWESWIFFKKEGIILCLFD